jgi:hypothetical protein
MPATVTTDERVCCKPALAVVTTGALAAGASAASLQLRFPQEDENNKTAASAVTDNSCNTGADFIRDVKLAIYFNFGCVFYHTFTAKYMTIFSFPNIAAYLFSMEKILHFSKIKQYLSQRCACTLHLQNIWET